MMAWLSKSLFKLVEQRNDSNKNIKIQKHQFFSSDSFCIYSNGYTSFFNVSSRERLPSSARIHLAPVTSSFAVRICLVTRMMFSLFSLTLAKFPFLHSEPAITCSKLTIETEEPSVKYVQS